MELHTVYEKFHLNKWNSVEINDYLYFISGKFKSIFIEVKLKLKNINQVLKIFQSNLWYFDQRLFLILS
jgi:hypothetical protein